MAKKVRKYIRRARQPVLSRTCRFCEKNSKPNYIKADELKFYMTERGRIINRKRGGLCAKHQRHLSRAVKRARFLALLPFVQKF